MPPKGVAVSKDAVKDNSVDSLVGQLQTAYTTFKEKEAAKLEAASAAQVALNDYNAAKDALTALQDKLNEMLGTAKGDPRIRMSA